jgi:CRISPR/Cas system-associated exonuclease Cas4 (RecB family)
MSYYNPPRFKNLFDPKSKQPFVLSRSKIDSFIKCPRCFYLDRRLGLGEPPMPSFTLNDAVDTLMKKEFDILRAKSMRHALMEKYNIDAVPLVHSELANWRDDNHKYLGATTFHKKTNFIISGIVDDVWVAPDKTLFIVDYKSTSTTKEISLDDEYKQGYKRQVEIYQWIFRQKGFKVSDTAYFVFANAQKNNEKFDGKLEFLVNIIAYKGSDNWVESTIEKIRACLENDTIPDYSPNCDFCKYRLAGQKLESKTPAKNNSATIIKQTETPIGTKIKQKEEKLTKQSLF